MLTTGNGVPPAQDITNRYVLPGEVVTASGPCRFVTVLGSCVAVCLYDLRAGVGGINHYLLPGVPGETDTQPCRWSETAIEELFRQMEKRGAFLRRMKAKVFGGAQISAHTVSGGFRIGERNIDSALQALQARRVEVVASSTGGSAGRKLVFEGHTGQAWVKNLQGQQS